MCRGARQRANIPGFNFADFLTFGHSMMCTMFKYTFCVQTHSITIERYRIIDTLMQAKYPKFYCYNCVDLSGFRFEDGNSIAKILNHRKNILKLKDCEKLKQQCKISCVCMKHDEIPSLKDRQNAIANFYEKASQTKIPRSML